MTDGYVKGMDKALPLQGRDPLSCSLDNTPTEIDYVFSIFYDFSMFFRDVHTFSMVFHEFSSREC